MFKALAIDLDDTLLDTTGLLAPKVTAEAFAILINAGLGLTPEQCESYRQEQVKTLSHREVFENIALQFGNDQTKAAAPIAIKTFYEPKIPDFLPLLEGARENLDYLKKKYPLYLVTAGAKDTQLQKAQSMGILGDFKKIYVVNSTIKNRKFDVFKEIIAHLNIQPSQLFCFGNSLSSEIKDALEIGATACHFDFGEERGALENLVRIPHFKISHHKELIPTCQL